MSKHVTTLPIDVEPVINALPKGYFLHSIELAPDKKSIQIVWEHDESKTGRTYPIEYPVEKLASLAPKVLNRFKKLAAPELWPFKAKVIK